MLRLVFRASKLVPKFNAAPIIQNAVKPRLVHEIQTRNISSVLSPSIPAQTSLLNNSKIVEISNKIVSRNVIKFSMTKGKRKSVAPVLRRFYRLNWGIWIRTKCGRHKKMWKKSSARRRRLRQHVFCNATQSTLLDKMAGAYWRKPKYYVDDPYNPYHTREEFPLTARKPKPYFPPEETVH